MVVDFSAADTREGVVRGFYAAVAAGDTDAISSVLDDHFADDAAIEWPASLPYGGRVEGAHRLRVVFADMVSGRSAVGPGPLDVLSISVGPGTVAAQLGFTFLTPGDAADVPSGALELWTFTAEKVSEIRAYYWDTAEILAALS